MTPETVQSEERLHSTVHLDQGSTFDLMSHEKTLKAVKVNATMTNIYFRFRHSKKRIEIPVILYSGDKLV